MLWKVKDIARIQRQGILAHTDGAIQKECATVYFTQSKIENLILSFLL